MSSTKYRRLNGAARLLRTLTRNRMALIGLVLLIGSVFVAVAAPLLTPYDPKSSIVAGARAAPGWMRSFPDGYYLSGDVTAVEDPLFNSPQAVQAWTLNASSTAVSNTIVSYSPGVSSSNRTSKGSLQVNYGGTSAGSVTLYKTFNYPYNGPPDSFIASMSVLASGASTLNPVNVKIFINRIGDQSFNLWDQNVTESGVWLAPQPALDSRVTQLQQHLHVGSTTFGPAQVIFSAIQEYSYGVQLTFSGPAKINLDNTQLLTLKERPFVEAAKAVGAGRWRIISRHVFPNIVSLTYVNLALTVPAAILTESALEFLGLGDPSVVSWGNMFQHAEISGSLSIWWWVLPPGIAIALVSLSCVLIGYALDEIFNPRLRVRR